MDDELAETHIFNTYGGTLVSGLLVRLAGVFWEEGPLADPTCLLTVWRDRYDPVTGECHRDYVDATEARVGDPLRIGRTFVTVAGLYRESSDGERCGTVREFIALREINPSDPTTGADRVDLRPALPA